MNTEEVDKGGRPEHEPTDELRDQVEIAAYMGMNQVQIAAAIGVSKPTLAKHYAEELLNGHSKKRFENMAMLYETARKGNVAAQKYCERMGAMSVAPAKPAEGDQPSKRPDPLGKKEELNAAAKEPPPEGSKWSGLLN